MTKVILVLSSISSRLELWSVNHTSVCESFEAKVFKNIKFFGEMSIDIMSNEVTNNTLEYCS